MGAAAWICPEAAADESGSARLSKNFRDEWRASKRAIYALYGVKVARGAYKAKIELAACKTLGCQASRL